MHVSLISAGEKFLVVIINPDKQLDKSRFYLLWFERYLFGGGEQGEADVLEGRIMFVLKMTDKDLAYKKITFRIDSQFIPFLFPSFSTEEEG